MFRAEQTAEFSEWLGGGLSEMRIDYGPGYRCYYTIRERVICLLLCGSDKKDQDRAIRQARELLKTIG